MVALIARPAPVACVAAAVTIAAWRFAAASAVLVLAVVPGAEEEVVMLVALAPVAAVLLLLPLLCVVRVLRGPLHVLHWLLR